MAEPSKEAVSLVMRIKGKYCHGDPVDESHALEIDRFAAQRREEATPKFGEPAPRSFTGETPGPGWKISEETQRELEQMERRMGAPPQTGGEVLPSRSDHDGSITAGGDAEEQVLYDTVIAPHIGGTISPRPEIIAAIAEDALRERERVVMQAPLVAEARALGGRAGWIAAREAAAALVKPSRPFEEVIADAASADNDFAARIANADDFIRMSLTSILRREFRLVETAIRRLRPPGDRA